MRISYDEMKSTLELCLVKKGLSNDKADQAARIFTDSSCDGVYSHGLNRFPRVLKQIDEGIIDLSANPEIVQSVGALEVVDGHLGLGVLNATFCMERAIMHAREYGISCVALRNNNHWMRGATYGIQAVSQGMIGICFTNTCPNMPVWGAKDQRIGNNPLILAIPDGKRGIILDMAMSQFSYGKMEDLASREQLLSQNGGFDLKGKLTNEPKEILISHRPIPIGFWKGSGLSIMLDLLATILSSGNSTKDIGEQTSEYAVSQVFIAIDPGKISEQDSMIKKINETIAYLKESEPAEIGNLVYYPGEQSIRRNEVNRINNIPVDTVIWDQIIEVLTN